MNRLAIAAFAVLVTLSALHGQGVTGSITGSVRDISGAIVPNCSVTAESARSGRSWQTITNDAGIYNVPALPPDQYTLRV